MNKTFDVFRERLVNASGEQVKNLINQIENSRAEGDLSESERDNLMDIANRNLDAGHEDKAEE